ncbi:hypothetical protein [Zavarzinia sp. CC-PAN008]|uniref:hypothetical protein n=1 Tax=Zavarzinia sp. CC-PAN008 TaxID=3243332 RepID=UPI003F743DE9
MLASPYDAEVLVAARKVTSVLRGAGMGWGDLVPASAAKPTREAPPPPPPPPPRSAAPTRTPLFSDRDVFEALQNSSLLSQRQKLQIWAFEQEMAKGTLPERDWHYVRHVFRRAVIERNPV